MRIICWFTHFWNNQEEANRFEKHPCFSLAAWSKRADELFHPIAKVCACGTWSPPQLCPVKDLIVVNSGVFFTGVNAGRERHYSRCAVTAMMAWALNRDDWDLLVYWDHDALLGDIDFDWLIRDFWKSSATWSSSVYRGWPAGPLILMKRHAAQRWLHYRRCPNMTEPGTDPMHLCIEEEFESLYKDTWHNPWNTKLGYLDEPYRNPAPDVEGWPMAVWLRESSQVPYLLTQCPKAKPFNHARRID